MKPEYLELETLPDYRSRVARCFYTYFGIRNKGLSYIIWGLSRTDLKIGGRKLAPGTAVNFCAGVSKIYYRKERDL